MIKRLTLTNFQIHEHLSLELDPGVNVIMGRSGQGKSAILRALRWLVFNRPYGPQLDAFIRLGSQQMTVAVKLDNGTIIERSKGSHDNYYSIQTIADVEPRTLTSFGVNPPEEITKALNLSSLNFHRQFDPLFLLGESPSSIALTLNDLAGLEDIDEARKTVNSWKLEEEKTEATLKSNRDQLTRLLQQYNDLESLEKDQERMSELHRSSQEKREATESIRQMVQVYQYRKTQVDKYKEVPELLTLFTTLKAAGDKVKDLLDQADKLLELCEEHDRVSKMIKQFADLDHLTKDLLALNQQHQKVKSLRNQITDLRVTLQQYRVKGESFEQLSKQYNTQKSLFDEVFPDVCPLCGLSKKRIRHEEKTKRHSGR